MPNFLSCEWRKVAMVNYAVDPGILKPYLPFKTQLDLRNNVCYVSLVGFMFLDTRTLGIKIPYHVNFEEVNLRFYVGRTDPSGEWRRGVVFIKEIVPRTMLAFVARTLYNENYQTMPMRHRWAKTGRTLEVEYQWKQERWNTMMVHAGSVSNPIAAGSDEEFIFEHYWGYTKVNDHKTFEYKVEHPRWEVYPVSAFHIEVDFGNVYGSEFAELSKMKPVSVFLAEGSEVKVMPKSTLT